ncbi:MAG: AI-2E family transporter [Ruminococcaceae bacterium]|nr:AI-2E family transporter [Oscillospiraceae bacterium]
MFKFSHNDKYKTIAAYSLAVIVSSALIIMGILNFSAVSDAVKKFFGILSPFTYGFIIAYLCNPILIFYEKHLFAFKKAKKDLSKLRRALSLILTVITAIAIIAVLAYAVIPQTVASVNDLGSKLNTYLGELQALADELTVKYSPIFLNTKYESVTHMLKDHEINFDLSSVISNSFVIFKDSFDQILSTGSRIVSEVINILMGIFLAIYFLISKEKLCAQGKKILAALLSRRAYLNTIRLARHTHKTFGGFLIGKIIDSAIIGVLAFICLWILKMPYYPLLAVIIGVTNIVPTFGPIFGGIIGGIIVVIVAPERLLVFVIFVFLIQQLDGNVIGPHILGDSIGISPIWVVIAIILASGLFGFIGMVLGVPAVGVVYTLVKQSCERKLKKKNMPKSTEFYKNDPPITDELDPGQIFIDKDTLIPEITSEDDIPEPLTVKESAGAFKKIAELFKKKTSKGKK